MNSETIQKLNKLIESLNTKQKSIAKGLILNKRFRIFESVVRNEVDLFIEDINTKEITHLLTYIKSNCNCD